jgi:presenilin-like A22 family membrane protease
VKYFSIFIKEALIFISIILVAIFVASRTKPQELYIQKGAFQEISVLNFILVFLIGTFIIIFLMKFFPSHINYGTKFLWLIALFGGGKITFDSFLPSQLSTLISLALTLIYSKAKTVEFHNLMLMISIPGIGALLGIQILPINAAIVLAILSVYDIVAVYLSGHMVKMAKNFIESGVIPGLIIKTKKTEISKTNILNSVIPGQDVAILGTGDLVLPTILIVSAFHYVGSLSGIFSALGALLGLLTTNYLFFSQPQIKPMPALPPIATGSILGFFVSFLI